MGRFGRMALKLYNIIYETSRQSRFHTGYWMLGAGAETTQRDGMGWEVGGGFRIGNTCIPVADAC